MKDERLDILSDMIIMGQPW